MFHITRTSAKAWHKGYNQQDENVYWKWVSGRSCQDVQNGCWHVAVITKNGCRRHFNVVASEYQGGRVVSGLLNDQAYGIPAKTPWCSSLTQTA